MTTLLTKHTKYKKDCKAFFCSIDSLGKRGIDVLSLGEDVYIHNPATGGNKLFRYLYQSKKYWCYQTLDHSLSLIVYKGLKYQGVPSPGIVVPPKEQPQVVNMVSTLPDGYPLMFEI